MKFGRPDYQSAIVDLRSWWNRFTQRGKFDAYKNQVYGPDGQFCVTFNIADATPLATLLNVLSSATAGDPIGETEPVFLLRAKDRFMCSTLSYYAACLNGADAQEMKQSILEHIRDVETWQEKHGMKTPDLFESGDPTGPDSSKSIPALSWAVFKNTLWLRKVGSHTPISYYQHRTVSDASGELYWKNDGVFFGRLPLSEEERFQLDWADASSNPVPSARIVRVVDVNREGACFSPEVGNDV